MMHTLKLARLASYIVQASKGHLSVEMLYASLDLRGPQNGHLAISKDYDGTYEMRRETLLTGDEEIRGDYLVLDYCNHEERICLTEYKTLENAERYILGGAGVFNSFTNLVLVFDHLRLRNYRVTYRSRRDDRRVEFDITARNIADRPYRDRRIEWLGWNLADAGRRERR